MNETANHETLLLAYVDGRTNSEETARVETMLQTDPSLRRRVEQLRRSALPYRDAFATALNDPVPQPVVDFIEQWRDAGAESSTQTMPTRRFGYAAVLLLGLLLGGGVSQWLGQADTTPPWLAQVASYHELYVRETVASARADDSSKQRLRNTMQKIFGVEVAIPDLTQSGLEFKRGQLLRIEKAPLVQLAYLPAQGVPVALCLTPRGDPDRGIVYGSSHNLQYASWARNGISYVLLAAPDFAQFDSAAQSAVEQL